VKGGKTVSPRSIHRKRKKGGKKRKIADLSCRGRHSFGGEAGKIYGGTGTRTNRLSSHRGMKTSGFGGAERTNKT